MREKGIFRIVVIALLLPLLLGVAAADATKKKKKPKSPPVVMGTDTASTNTDGQIVTPTATCPPGTIALGGGFSGEIGRETTPTDLYVVNESRRDSPTSWQISAGREDAGTAGNTISISVTVYCQKPKLGKVNKASAAKKHKHRKLAVTEVSTAGSVAASSAQSTASSSCPGKLSLISGGFSVSPPPNLVSPPGFPFVWTNHATSAKTWTASETTNGPISFTLTSYAYCANTRAPLAITGSGSALSGETGSASTQACPANRPLISGGFDNTPVIGPGPAEVAYESTGSGGGWTASAYDVGASPAALQAIAYCR